MKRSAELKLHFLIIKSLPVQKDLLPVMTTTGTLLQSLAVKIFSVVRELTVVFESSVLFKQLGMLATNPMS